MNTILQSNSIEELAFVFYGVVLVQDSSGIDENVDCEPVFLTVVYIAVQTYVARVRHRAATTISQHMNSVQLNLL